MFAREKYVQACVTYKLVSHARWGENVVLDPRPVPASLPIHTSGHGCSEEPRKSLAQRRALCGQKRKQGEAKNLPTHYSANRNTPFLLRDTRPPRSRRSCVSLTGGRGAASLRTPTTLTRHHDTRLRPPRVTKRNRTSRERSTPPPDDVQERTNVCGAQRRCLPHAKNSQVVPEKSRREPTTRCPRSQVTQSSSRRTKEAGELPTQARLFVQSLSLPPWASPTSPALLTHDTQNTEHKRQLNCGNQPTTEVLLRRQQHRKPPHSGPKTLMIHRRTSDQDAATKNKPSLRWAKTRLAALRSFLPLRGELRPPH